MEDLYSLLIGEGAGQGEKAALIAAALRRRNQLGQLGMLTGDKMLSQVGQGLSKSSDAYAEQLQNIRQKAIDDEQTRLYQGGQLEHMRNSLAETKRSNNLEHQYRMAMAEAAGVRADKAGTGGRIPKLRQADIKELENKAEILDVIKTVRDHIQGGGGYGAKQVGGLPIPGARALANWAASKGVGSEQDKEAFRIKQSWDRLYTLGTRNALFGATLTANEQAAWEAANPSIWQTNEQIVKALNDLEAAAIARRDRKVSGLVKEGYSEEALADYANTSGINSQVDAETTAKTPRRVKVDAQGNIIQ